MPATQLRPVRTAAPTLRPRPVPASQLMWCPDERIFVTEASTLGAFGRVFADACDVGLTLMSRFPGRPEIVFVVEHVERRDGDTLWWDLVAVNAPRESPAFTVRVFND